MCLSSRADRRAEPDAQPVVVRRAEGEQLRRRAAGVYSATMSAFITKPPAAITTDAGADQPGLVEPPPGHARRPRRRLGPTTQVGRAGLVADLDAGLLDPRRAAGPSPSWRPRCRRAPAPCGRAAPASAWSRNGPDLLVAGEHQALGAGLDHRLLGVVGPLELEARAPRASRSARPSRRSRRGSSPRRGRADRHQVLVHLLGGVLVAGRPLHRRTAAEVEVAAGHRARCRRAPRPAPAAAPARRPAPPRAPRTRRRCRSRPPRRRTPRRLGGRRRRRGGRRARRSRCSSAMESSLEQVLVLGRVRATDRIARTGRPTHRSPR